MILSILFFFLLIFKALVKYVKNITKVKKSILNYIFKIMTIKNKIVTANSYKQANNLKKFINLIKTGEL